MFAHIGGVEDVVGVKMMQFVEDFAKAFQPVPLVVNHFAVRFAADKLQHGFVVDVAADKQGVFGAVLLDGSDDVLFVALDLFEIAGSEDVEFGFFVAKDFFAVFDADFFGEGGAVVVVGKT